MNDKKRWLTTKELANRWGLATNTLEQWRGRGKGPKWIKFGKNGAVRYGSDDADEYEKENGRGPGNGRAA
jgi:hypothetical protein